MDSLLNVVCNLYVFGQEKVTSSHKQVLISSRLKKCKVVLLMNGHIFKAWFIGIVEFSGIHSYNPSCFCRQIEFQILGSSAFRLACIHSQ